MFLLLVALLPALALAVTSRPTIGIVTQPSSTYGEYVAGSYVKFVEGAGARAVLIRYNSTRDELAWLFSRLNGLVLPGGSASLSPNNSAYFAAGRSLFELAVGANDGGDPFPILGICLGFEELMVLGAGANRSVLTASGKFDAEDLPLPLRFAPNGAESRLIEGLPDSAVEALRSNNLTYNAHSAGVTPEVFSSNGALASFFTVVATSTDRGGKEFVAAAEAKRYPFFATQFHPEKSLYEWPEGKAIPHSENASAVAQHFANLLVGEARRSDHAFAEGEADALLAEAFVTTYQPKGYFLQIYNSW